MARSSTSDSREACNSKTETGMSGAAECQKRGAQKMEQAEQEPRHRRKLMAAAQAWLLLASRLRQLEEMQHGRENMR